VSSRANEPEVGATALEAVRVSFGDGEGGFGNLTTLYRVRMVRGGDDFDVLDTPVVGGGRLNDTGRTSCFDGTAMVECTAEVSGDETTWPRQDGRFGRDARARAGILAKVGGGSAGFDFTPLDATGQEIPLVDGAPASTPVCVRDNVTGLTWEVKTPENSRTLYTRGQAFTFANAANSDSGLCGLTGWRVPKRRELLSIVDYERNRPAVDTRFFPNTVGFLGSAGYWAIEQNRAQSFPLSYATVLFAFGEPSNADGTTGQYVRLVNGTQFPETDFADNGDGTVTDLSTGLTWDKCEWGQAWDAGANECAAVTTSLQMPWREAVRIPNEANVIGHRGQSDWRLPSMKELESLMFLNRDRPVILSDTVPGSVFYNFPRLASYWTSTVSFTDGSTTTVWSGAFNYGGFVRSTLDTFLDNRGVRLVRGGDDFDALE
jgi:hypothetical protein